jgi:hypothetical protein
MEGEHKNHGYDSESSNASSESHSWDIEKQTDESDLPNLPVDESEMHNIPDTAHQTWDDVTAKFSDAREGKGAEPPLMSSHEWPKTSDETDRLLYAECIRDLRLTDPRDDKRRIEETKGGLLEDTYNWILEHSDFQRWRHGQQTRLLWIKGNPGAGKTMLLCGIINELEKSKSEIDNLSYFFCQATDTQLNSATAVLRGLLYLLVNQQPSLASHIRRKYDHAGKALLEDANAWVTLSEILVDILQDPKLNRTYLIIDALDECTSDLPKLLDFVVQNSCASSRVRWIVSSRNWSEIQRRLEGQEMTLCLELNAERMAAAVNIFIEYKVLQLALRKNYNDETRDSVLNYLFSNADSTFLWVSLVCQILAATSLQNTPAKLRTLLPGLRSLYSQIMQQICRSGDANLLRHILALMAVVYRPLTLLELTALVNPLDGMAQDLKSIREAISLCGSFLAYQADTVYFVHQSAKDFLFVDAASEIFPLGTEAIHYSVFSRSLAIMSTLQRDIYSLRDLGYPIELVEPPNPDPLAASRYSCMYWFDHLSEWSLTSTATSLTELRDDGVVHRFVKEKFLYWLEALSLCKSLLKGVGIMLKLKVLVNVILTLHNLSIFYMLI